MNKIKNILFVCLGNTARSPAASYLAQYYAKKYNANLIFESAGFINAFSYIQTESRDYLQSKGIDHSGFRPKLINRKLLENQDLVLTMERSHSIDIIGNYNTIKDIDKKTYTLREFNGEIHDLDIIDPYYTSNKTYRKVLRIIDEQVEKAVKKIIQINKDL